MISIQEVSSIEQIKAFLESSDNLAHLKAFLPSDFNLNAYLEKVTEYGINFFLYEANESIGYASIYVNDTDGFIAFLSMIILNDKSRGHGHGARFLDACIDHAKFNGMKSMELEVHVENTKALNFYQKRGFDILRKDGSYQRLRKVL